MMIKVSKKSWYGLVVAYHDYQVELSGFEETSGVSLVGNLITEWNKKVLF